MRASNGMAYRRAGSGPAVVLVHGIPGQGRAWERVETELVGSFDVLTVDLLGFGDSAEPASLSMADIGPEAQARAVAGLLDELGIAGAVLVGHDYGVPVAILLASARPDLGRGLVLLAGNTFPDTPIPFPLSLAAAPGIGGFFSRLLFSRTSLSFMLRSGAASTTPPDPAIYIGASTQRQAIAAIFGSALTGLEDMYAPVAQALGELTMPVRVGWGDRDPFFPLEQGRRTAHVARGRLRVFHERGHFLPHECPEEVAGEITALAAAVGP